MGRTETDRKITSEPWSSMHRGQQGTRKPTLRSEGTSAFKKYLTEPTLLEMSGNPTQSGVESNVTEGIASGDEYVFIAAYERQKFIRIRDVRLGLNPIELLPSLTTPALSRMFSLLYY
jgi:hypothetical protein